MNINDWYRISQPVFICSIVLISWFPKVIELRWAHTAEDATHDCKNLISVSDPKTSPKTIPFPQYFMTKGGQFRRTKGSCFSLYQQHFGSVV